MEFVTRKLTGYKSVSEDDASHALLTLDEYRALQLEIRRLTAENAQLIVKGRQDLEALKNKANGIIADKNDQLAQVEQKMQQEVAKEKYRNENLIRIGRERANAMRGITPKKEHHGFILLDCGQYVHRHRWKSGKQEIHNAWKVRLQSPFSASLPYDSVYDRFFQALMKEGISSSLGLTNVMILPDIPGSDDLKTVFDRDKNTLFGIAAKRNFRSGLWEFDLLVSGEIQVPDDMLLKYT